MNTKDEKSAPKAKKRAHQLKKGQAQILHLVTKHKPDGIAHMSDSTMHPTAKSQTNSRGIQHTTPKYKNHKFWKKAEDRILHPVHLDGSHMIMTNAEKYLKDVWWEYVEPAAHDIHKATQAIPILNREDPGCKCCYCCNPCPCIDSWNRCGEGEGLTFGGKQLSDEPLTLHVMHVGHNCSHYVRSNDLFWAVLDIFESFGEEIVLEDDEKEAAEAAKANLHTVNKTMEHNDIIQYFILGDQAKQQKVRQPNHDAEPDHMDMMIDIATPISQIAAGTGINKDVSPEKWNEALQDAYKEKWGGNIFAVFEMNGGFYRGFAQAGKTMTHDNKPFHFHWDKVCHVVEFCGGEVSFEQFLQILGLQQRSECGKILCCCCEKECCGGETFCNNVTCQICGDSKKWSKPGYCKESGGPCGCCYESCGCHSCCDV